MLGKIQPLLLFLFISFHTVHAEELLVAVASNFVAPAKELSQEFTRITSHNVSLSFGSTGKLYAQITNGAPYQVFLAADQESPSRLVSEGLAERGSQFTYARGRIVLYCPTLEADQKPEEVLKSNGFTRLAIANPKTAPYGRAAMEVFQNLGIFKNLGTRIIQGNNIAQTFQFVSTGNAELGFVSGSQVINIDPELYWTIPIDLYRPIQQDAVLLQKGLEKKAAREFLDFLNSDPARKIIQSFGYDLE
ncbi:MAG: molybdate ABC transporter substrate-binding protein [Deltaproteobacteria bacterium]